MKPRGLTLPLLLAVDLAGTFVFAVEGATSAIAAHLDPLGVMVLAFSTALAGGLIRDLLIGAAPPQCMRDWRYATAAFGGGAVVMGAHPLVQAVPAPLIVGLDAAGLALFAVAGADKALAYRMPALIAILMGAITGAGGGTVRDLLLNEIPRVLRADVYAAAALAGATVLVGGRRLGWSATLAAALGGAVCFVVRIVSYWQGLNLPTLW